jgi:hypothetical protein
VNSAVPRLGPSIVRRPRLEEWLGRFRGVPVRFLIAPPGFGKTVTLLSYLRHCAPEGLYCPLAAGSNARRVWQSVAKAIGADGAGTSHDEVVRALAARTPLELAIDCDDVPAPDGVGAILRLIEDASEDVSLLIASRSRVAFQVNRLVSQAMAALCDVEQLAFTRDTIRHLAETCNVRFFHTDVVRLLELTDGWPQVVSSAIRKAAEDGRSLYAAFENWRTRRGHFFSEFIATTLANAPETEADMVRRLMTGSLLDDRELQHLEERGLFVVHTAEGYRPLHALSRSRLHDRYVLSLQPPSPMHVRLFGWFQAEIDGRPIEWIRRRDRQIFKYVALAPGGTVSRQHLGQVFWPDTERHLVAQSVRTACSNIRKAIAQVAGFDRVGAYFHANDEVAIDFDNVVVDTHRFMAHVDDGDDQFERGDPKSAYGHYRSAEQLYGGNLLIADAHEPWVAAPATTLEQCHSRVLKRLMEMSPPAEPASGYGPAAAAAAES